MGLPNCFDLTMTWKLSEWDSEYTPLVSLLFCIQFDDSRPSKLPSSTPVLLFWQRNPLPVKIEKKIEVRRKFIQNSFMRLLSKYGLLFTILASRRYWIFSPIIKSSEFLFKEICYVNWSICKQIFCCAHFFTLFCTNMTSFRKRNISKRKVMSTIDCLNEMNWVGLSNIYFTYLLYGENVHTLQKI